MNKDFIIDKLTGLMTYDVNERGLWCIPTYEKPVKTVWQYGHSAKFFWVDEMADDQRIDTPAYEEPTPELDAYLASIPVHTEENKEDIHGRNRSS